MKSHVKIGALVLVIAPMAQLASAYQLAPPQTRSVLAGVLTFTPDGRANPFTCSVQIYLRTRGQTTGRGVIKSADIEKLKLESQGLCRIVQFFHLPWEVSVTSISGGQINGGTWSIGSESCVGNIINFALGDNGAVTLPSGGCMSGGMSSNPQIQIIP